MPNIPTLFPAEVIDCEPPCEAVDDYIIRAYWLPGKRWKIFPCLWDSEEIAKGEAERLAPGWIHRKVIHLKWGPG